MQPRQRVNLLRNVHEDYHQEGRWSVEMRLKCLLTAIVGVKTISSFLLVHRLKACCVETAPPSVLRETCAELTQGFVICVASLHAPRPIACQAPASSVVPASAAPCSSLVQSGCYWSVKQEWLDLARCHMQHDRRVAKAKAAAHDDDADGATASASALVVGEIDKEASGAAKEKNEATATVPTEEHDSETARNDSETKRNHALIVQQMLALTNRQYEGTDTMTSEVRK